MSDLNYEVESVFEDHELAEQLMNAREARDNLFALVVILAKRNGGKLTFTQQDFVDLDMDQAIIWHEDMLTDTVSIELFDGE